MKAYCLLISHIIFFFFINCFLEILHIITWYCRYGKIYVKAAKSSLEKGSDYAKNEVLRLERILAKVNPYFLCSF